MLVLLHLFLISFTESGGCSGAGNNLFSIMVVSDTNAWVVGPDQQNGGNAVAVQTPYHPAWTATISGATWIWDAAVVSSPTIDQTSYFTNEFYVQGTPTVGSFYGAGDNNMWVSINGHAITSYSSNFNAGPITSAIDVTSSLRSGLNILQVTVTNIGGSSSAALNPAGALYKLLVQSKSS